MRKNRINKLFCTLLCCVLCLTVLPVSASAAARFTDVPSGSWYEDAVYDLVEKGVINGTSPTTFSPEQTLTRAAFVTMLAKTSLSEADLGQYKFKGKFSDVANGSWANHYINWASEAGVVSGYENGKFQPNKAVSRQEMALMIVNFARATGRVLNPSHAAAAFQDNASIASWAASSVKLCQQCGIIGGYEDNTFRPKGLAKRREAASLYSLFLKNCPFNSGYTITRKRVNGIAVRAVEFNPSNYTAGIAMGEELVDGKESVTSMVSRTGAKFAVNAAFFNMDSHVPYATIIRNGNLVTTDNSYAPKKPAFNMDSAGTCSIESFSTSISATLTTLDGYETSLNNLVVNKWPSSDTDPTRILFTRDWGHRLFFTARDALTFGTDGIITAKTRDKDEAIPGSGFVLAQQARREYEGDFFDSAAVGASVKLSQTYKRADGTQLDDIQLSIASGPRIVKDGAVYGGLDTYRSEGYADSLTAYAAIRVCIGIKPNGNLVIAQAYCTVQNLAGVMAAMGCRDAMNLDGGGSANIFVDGTWLYGPQSRLLNNILYFK